MPNLMLIENSLKSGNNGYPKKVITNSMIMSKNLKNCKFSSFLVIAFLSEVFVFFKNGFDQHKF